MPQSRNRTTLIIPVVAFALILASATSACANNAPSPLAFGLLLMQIFLLIGLTTLGGGYLALRRLKEIKYPKKSRRTINTILEVLAGTIMFLLSVSMPVLIMLILGIYAIERGITLVIWGWKAGKNQERPAHLVDLQPQRLKMSGALLVLAMLLIGVYSLFNVVELSGFGIYQREGYANALNSDTRNAYAAAQRYLEKNPQARMVTCADLESSGYTPSRPDLTCISDLGMTSGSIRIAGPEKWQLRVPVATIDAAGTLTPAQR